MIMEYSWPFYTNKLLMKNLNKGPSKISYTNSVVLALTIIVK